MNFVQRINFGNASSSHLYMCVRELPGLVSCVRALTQTPGFVNVFRMIDTTSEGFLSSIILRCIVVRAVSTVHLRDQLARKVVASRIKHGQIFVRVL